MKKYIPIIMFLIGVGCILYPIWIVEPVIVTVVSVGFFLCGYAGYLNSEYENKYTK